MFIIIPISSYSRDPDPCNDPFELPACGCPGDSQNPACPIDGGVVALLAAGVGYGIKRAKDTKKKNAAT